ncbi:MAG: response regulator [Pseudobacteriovorax sp.]|nr:response regulator [Pseudobacteriovorax sp.]
MCKIALIVDDETELVEMLHDGLKIVGISSLTAGNPKDAINIIDNDKTNISIVITDIYMKDGTGLEIIEHIRSTNLKDRLPVYVMSAGPPNKLSQETTDLMTGYIEKPFNVDDIVELIERIIE